MTDSQTALARLASATLQGALKWSPVVVVTGARQTGKTTLVQSLPGADERRYVTLDSVAELDHARGAPEPFVRQATSLTIDEVQRAPELLLEIKRAVDEGRGARSYLLTGSANLLLMKQVSESLAGRAIYVTLRPLTEREKDRQLAASPWKSLIEAVDADAALASLPPVRSIDWRKAVLAGGLPAASRLPTQVQRQAWFDGYVETYLHRDLRDLALISDLPAFSRLLRLLALRTGGILNQALLARDAQLSGPTARRWLGLLETTYQISLVQPFFESRIKRLMKAPKLYPLDTGVALHLAGIPDEASLDRAPASGAWLEALVLNDLLAWRDTYTPRSQVHHYRTQAQVEIDFVVECGRRVLPIEIKSSAEVRVEHARAIDELCQELPDRAPFGILLYDGDRPRRLTRHTLALPLGCVL